MEITYNNLKNILKTLPIGYYIGRNIPVTMEEFSNMSYYNPAKDEIVIGYKLILDAYNKVEHKYRVEDEESVIRGLLYHEVSHAMLTPDTKYLFSVRHNLQDIINIFEDERIETLLRTFYMNVNFKRNVVFLNNYDGTRKPENARDAFYQAVRFRNNEKYNQRIISLINKYKRLNATTQNCSELNNYVYEIERLWLEIKQDFEDEQKNNRNNANNGQNGQNSENNNDQQSSDNQSSNNNEEQNGSNSQSSSNENSDEQKNENSEQNGNNSEQNDEQNSNCSEQNDESEQNDGNSKNSSKSSKSAGKGDMDNSDESDTSSNTEDDNVLTDKEVESLIDTKADPELTVNEIKESFKKVTEFYNDAELTTRLSQIIEAKKRKDNRNGSAIDSYSGRFNVRSVANREDYRWWNANNRAGHVKRFSKVHLNLYVDNSGSFRDNDVNMNRFIQSLNKINDKDFSFSVTTINTRIVEWETTKKMFQSGGGTYLGTEIKDVVKRHQYNDRSVYNIVLFDGDADPADIGGGKNTFAYFDDNHSIIVSDSSNRNYINRSVSKAKVVITEDYCNRFIEETLKLLEKVL